MKLYKGIGSAFGMRLKLFRNHTISVINGEAVEFTSLASVFMQFYQTSNFCK